ncbi:MAG: RDD family protein [Pyrinomonadaceae bacterium]
MSARVERAVPAKRIKTQKIVRDFDVDRLKSPFMLRCGALLIDYILLISVPVISILLARFSGEDGAKLLNSEINNTGWLITVLLGLTNFVIFPLFTGQSIGKMLTGLRVVKMDGTNPTLGSLLLRHLIGYPLTALTLGLGFVFSVFNRNARALHDYLAGTVVVYGRRRVEKKFVKPGESTNNKLKGKKAQKKLTKKT